MGVSKRQAMLDRQEKPNEHQEYNTVWLEEQAPTVVEMMTKLPSHPIIEKSASITIFAEDGTYKVLVNDRALARKCFMTLRCIDQGFWKAVEEYVTDEVTPWKLDEKSKDYRQRS